MIRSGFFNSVNGDRLYNANKFAEYFNSFIGNGVFPNPSDNLQIMAQLTPDMTVIVKPGKAWVNGYILINDDDYILQIEPADGVLNRIDRIVARYDVANREITLTVKKGTFASSSIAPTLQRDADAYELGIADVLVSNGSISITQAEITDLRLSSEYCGIVHGTVDQVDVTTLYNQYTQGFQLKQDEFEQEFLTWFATLRDVLDENTATNLFNMINTLDNTVATHLADYVQHKTEVATTTNIGHMSKEDKIKLDNIEKTSEPSDFIKAISASEISIGVSQTTYKKIKEIKLNVDGGVRVSFDLVSGSTSYTAYGKIYINGIAMGTERSSQNSNYITFSEDFINLKKGDLMQLYCKTSSGGIGSVKNFSIKYSINLKNEPPEVIL